MMKILERMHLSIPTEDTLRYNIQESKYPVLERFLTFEPYETITYKLDKEEHNLVYLNYYQDIDTLELVSFFEKASR